MPYEVTTFTLPCGAKAVRVVGIGAITKEDADALIRQVEPGGPLYGLPQFHLTQRIEKVSPEARNLISARTKGKMMAWSAVVGSSPLIRVTVNFLLRVSGLSTTTRMFTTEPPAIAWLDERAREDAAKKTAAT